MSSRGHQATPQPRSWAAGSLSRVGTWSHCSMLSAHKWLIFSFIPSWGNNVWCPGHPKEARRQVWFFHLCFEMLSNSSLELQHFLEAAFSFQDCWFWLICHISLRHTSPVLCVNLQQHILDSCKFRHPPAPIRLTETPSSFFSFLCWPQLTSAVKSCLPHCLPACVHMVCRTWMHQTTSQYCCFLLPVFFILSVETIKDQKPLLIKFTQLLSLQMKSWHHNRDFGPWLPPLQSALKEDNAFPERRKP